MKRFFALFLTFFTVSLLALGAAYIDGKMQPQHNEEHLWHDTLQRLNELGRQQHHQSIRYQHYAIHAQQAQEPQIAALFRAMAFVEEEGKEKTITPYRICRGDPAWSPACCAVIVLPVVK